MSRPLEKNFEDHFCQKLEDHSYRKRLTKDIDLKINIDDSLLTEFLESTQKEELKEIKSILGDRWLAKIKETVNEKLKNNKLFEIIKNGITIETVPIKLIYFKPETTFNKEQLKKYESNIFSYVRQFKFRDTMESIDIVLFLNGFALVTIELKSPFNGQVVDDAVVQYIADRDKTLQIFKTPILHIAADTKNVKITTEFLRNNVEDFVWFNKELENPIVEDEFQVEYLYNEILLPESLIEVIEHYLSCFKFKLQNGKKVTTFFFPRYHQRRTVLKLTNDIIKNYKKKRKLDLKYLIQHSAGSGKSYTIAVIQKFLRYIHINNEAIFNSILILTDRINLDTQLKGTIGSSETQKNIISYVDSTAELAEALNKNTKVIISTIQKFSVKKLDEILESQKGKKICFILDEAHRSQSGKLQRHLLGHFEEDEPESDKKYFETFYKRKFPNFVFVALTATPSEKTLTMFGEPFDVYSMDQAEQEGHILNVSENIVTYSTLFQLSEKLKSQDEYPPMIVAKKLKNKAYEDINVIKDKISVILKIFDAQTKYAIKNESAKTMIVTSSRKSAVKYKVLLDQIIKQKNLPYKSLVAFTGGVKLSKSDLSLLNQKEDSENFTEKNMNKVKDDIEEVYKKTEYRFLIVANKYQYGFNEPLLHTMFLDKSVADINAVQTISRLNRIYPNKNNTLVVDFTNSYKKIIKAFQKFKKEVNDYSGINVKELPELYNELLNKNIFTRKDIQEFKIAYYKEENSIKLDNIASTIEKRVNSKFSVDERRAFRGSLNKFNKTYSYLNNLIKINDDELKDFALFSHYLFKYLNPEGKSRKLDEELKKVFLLKHRIKLEKTEPLVIRETGPKYGAKRQIRYATVKEVVDAINTKYKVLTTDNEKVIIEDYINKILTDEEIKSDLEGNKDKDLDKVYEAMISKKLGEKFIDFFIEHNPEKLSEYLQTGISKFINLEAFRLAAREVGVI
ncbi:type I restriction endonuclease subunit R [archaeon]|jgi:type I restriction enzyme, R subunit|nr:type I restriction endonuclease subunit R [archaeon]MBT4271774.1 type I restriction endonuclease subunit R [archaeon]MBT4461418.1 type I restriction endonuclease subunit R [archaeon]MBT6772838.1 type I restriction endonuclease subunit R [archaeon]MBT7392888.1 type I restriction endonuclease subunit R [archaeon]